MMIEIKKIRALVLFFVMLSVTPSLLYAIAVGDESKFSEYEIRVIRPKYFIKQKRVELGVAASLVMNNSFVYTGLVNAMVGYHFSESLGAELNGAFGHSIDKKDKDTLLSTFLIRTDIKRTLFLAMGSLMYTPAYGKVQLPGGTLIYFDTFLSAGGGMVGVDWQYSDFCMVEDQSDSSDVEIKEDAVGAYPGFVLGLGQRIFYSKTSAVRWDLKLNGFVYSNSDADCYKPTNGGVEDTGSSVFYNVLLQLGWSRFF